MILVKSHRMGFLLFQIDPRRPNRILEAELALESTAHKATNLLGFHVIPSEARNPYDGSYSEVAS
jgi:hypothetical protein